MSDPRRWAYRQIRKLGDGDDEPPAAWWEWAIGGALVALIVWILT